MSTRSLQLASICLLSLCACSDKSKSSASASASSAPAVMDGVDISGWDLTAIRAAWKGNWVVKDSGHHAWGIEGESMQWHGTMSGPETENKTTLILQTPCKMGVRRTDKDGGWVEVPFEFTIVEGKLYPNRNGAGFKKGEDAIYCDPGGAVYRLVGGKCTVHKHEVSDRGAWVWTTTAGKCAWAEKDGKKLFTLEGSVDEQKLIEVKGDAIMATSSFTPLEFASYEEAKKKADELNKK